MIIPPERAFGLLEFYRIHEKHLVFGGRILGEEGACPAVVSHVWREIEAIGIKLLSDDGGESWDRLIRLSRAALSLIQMGDPEFEQFPKAHFCSILVIRFPDETTMFLAEQSPRN